MKNFDLEAAKRGAAVCTRGGFPVRIICWDMKCKSYGDMDRIVYLTDYTGDEHLSSCWLNGSYLTRGAMDKSDLMMRDDDYVEKLERGEYDHIADARKMVGPAIKQNLTTDREYWRYEFAGRAMSAQIAGVLINGAVNRTGKSTPDIITEDAVLFADALIEELEKTDTK